MPAPESHWKAFSCLLGLLILCNFSAASTSNTSVETKLQEVTPVDSFYEGCGTTKGCFFCSEGFKECNSQAACSETKDCYFAVNYDVSEVETKEEVQFSFFRMMTPSAANTRWVGFGISADDKMGDDSIVTCEEQKDGSAKALAYFSAGRTPPQPILNPPPEGSFMEPNASFIDGYLICSYKRKVSTIVQGITFDLAASKYHLLLARGPLDLATGELAYHEPSGRVSSPALDLTSAVQKADSFYDGCGETKVCFGCTTDFQCTFESGCLDSQDCNILMSYDPSDVEIDGTVQFSVFRLLVDATEPQWVAMGINTQRHMCVHETLHPIDYLDYDMDQGEGSFVICEQDGEGQVTPKVYFGVEAEGRPKLVETPPEESFLNLEGAFQDGILSCSYKHKVLTELEGVTFDFKESLYYMLVASGAMNTTAGVPGYHEGRSRKASRVALNLTIAEVPPEPTEVPGTDAPPTWIDEFYDGCGSLHGCMACSRDNKCGIDLPCISTKNCPMMVNYVLEDDLYKFSFYGTAQWVGLAFSVDEGMGPSDSAVICGPDVKDGVQALPYWLSGFTDPTLLTDVEDGVLMDAMASSKDGYLVCSFSRKSVTTVQDTEFDFAKDSFYLLLAQGPWGSDNPNPRTIRGHSPAAVDLNEVADPEAPFYNGCGQTKVCFGCTSDFQCVFEAGCLDPRNCTYLMSYDPSKVDSDSSVAFSVFRRLEDVTEPQWVAMGFNTARHMGNGSFMICQQTNDGQVTPQLYFGVKEEGRPTPIDDYPTDSFLNFQGSFEDGLLTCSYEQKISSELSGTMYDFKSTLYYLMMASGVMNTTASLPGYHHDGTRKAARTALNLTLVELPQPTSAPPTDAPPSWIDRFYDGCGTSQGCLACSRANLCGNDVSCISSKNCPMMLNYVLEDDLYKFSFYGSAAWVGMAFSKDAEMGPADSTVICGPDGQGGVQALPYWMTGTIAPTLLKNVDEGVLMDATASSIDGYIICSFSRQKVTTVQDVMFDFGNESYYLLFAQGVWGGNAPLLHTIRGTGASAIDLNDVIGTGTRSRWKLEAHAICMILAWIGSASSGILTARYYKKTWVGVEACGKAIWFVLHMMYMGTTFVLTVAGFAFILDETQEFELEGAHPIVGFASIVLAFVQPFMAMFRCEPDHPRRPIFNWGHFLVGNTAHLLAVVNIFLAVDMERGGLNLPYVAYWILTPAVAVYLLSHVVLTVSGNMNKNSHDFNTFTASDKYDDKGARVRRIVFILQITVAWTLALILCLIVTGNLAVSEDGKSFI